MDSLVGYGSDEDNDSERYDQQTWDAAQGSRRRDDDNYDTVNMDMSEESRGEESEPELPQAESPAEHRDPTNDRQGPDDTSDRNRDHDRDRDRDRFRDRDGFRDRDRNQERERARNQEQRDRRRDSPARTRPDKEKPERDARSDRRSPRRDDKSNRSERYERSRGSYEGSSRDNRRGLLGDRPDERPADSRMPALMDLKPFGGDAPPGFVRATDTRDAVSPRFSERDRRDKDRERDRDRDRHSRRSEERRSSREQGRGERRSRSRGASSSLGSSSERRGSPSSADYLHQRTSSYKVNKKLEVMEKMGLQIKTPDGSMTTAQQLRAAAHEPGGAGAGALPSYYNAAGLGPNKVLDQVQKRKLLWSNKNKSEAEEAAKWSGTRFAQDTDGKQVSKFMRLMGIKEPAALKTESESSVDPNKKQEELFQAMQAQYEVARATTHTMRGVGLGFQRGQF